MAEIEERQKYLEEIKHLNEKDLNEKIKIEIIERVSELQKVTELRKFYKKKIMKYYIFINVLFFFVKIFSFFDFKICKMV